MDLLCHLLAVRPRASYLPPLSGVIFPTCKMGITVVAIIKGCLRSLELMYVKHSEPGLTGSIQYMLALLHLVVFK